MEEDVACPTTGRVQGGCTLGALEARWPEGGRAVGAP